jgi:hypothetical protein
MAAISINWTDLGKVAEVAGAFAIGIVVVFAVGVLGLSRWETSRQAATDSAATARPNPFGAVLAGACFLACLAAAAFGIYLIVPQWGG